MTMIIEGPYPGIIQAVLLPNPKFGNNEGIDQSVEFRKAIDGTRYTYVKSSDRKTLIYTWETLGRGKLVEIQEFYKLYAGNHIKLTDFRADVWDAIFAVDPSLSIETRSVNAGAARKESGTITLEFLGVQIT
jgi:hypothetical protein